MKSAFMDAFAWVVGVPAIGFTAFWLFGWWALPGALAVWGMVELVKFDRSTRER